MENTKIRENRMRRQLTRQGYRLQKSRTDGRVYVNGIYQGENMDDRGGYQITDASTRMIVAGERFDLSLEDVEQWVTEEVTDDQESGLEERVKELDMKLRQDDDGCYWLEYVDQPDMRSLGPFDPDEIEDWITAAENGLSGEQIEEYVADQRWKRLHPET